MAHGTLIGGTAYQISGGKVLIGGTGYSISSGRTLIGGTGYSIAFTDEEREALRARLIAVQNSSYYATYSGELFWSNNGATLTQYTIAQHVNSWMADSVHNNPVSYPTATYRQAVADAEYSLNYYIENGVLRYTWNMYTYNAVLSHDGTLQTSNAVVGGGITNFYVREHALHKYVTNSTSDIPTFATTGQVYDSKSFNPGHDVTMWNDMTKIYVTFPHTITESGWYTGCVNAAATEILGRIIFLNAGAVLTLSDDTTAVPSAVGYSKLYYPASYSATYSKGSYLLGNVTAKPYTYPDNGTASYTGNDRRWFVLQK